MITPEQLFLALAAGYIIDITSERKIVIQLNCDTAFRWFVGLGMNGKYRIYNIGNHNPVKLSSFIEILEKKIGKAARKTYLEMQPGDVLKTYADVQDLENDIGFRPYTELELGLGKFVEWHRHYYKA